jgi:hypothetical protein
MFVLVHTQQEGAEPVRVSGLLSCQEIQSRLPPYK